MLAALVDAQAAFVPSGRLLTCVPTDVRVCWPFAELNPTSGSLPSSTPMSPSAISTQNLVMSSSGVGGDASVTLTLADTQGMLSGGLDTVTLNITSQVSPGLLGEGPSCPLLNVNSGHFLPTSGVVFST